MPEYEYRCMECSLDFGINLTDKEYAQKPKLLCPHCGAEHVHRKLPEGFTGS
ncbi:MAG: FmdB family zinc ribbon protein [Nitrospirota bacterium]